MTAEHFKRVEEVFERACVLPASERAGFLDLECSGDATLRAEVESLLRSDADAGDFLAEPALGDNFHVDWDEDAALDLTGTVVGAYKIERLLDAGGMGAVYVASRADAEYEKQVAIKLIRPAMVTAENLRRFIRERQALASLDHPNIARLLDGGTTGEGQPYLVMEYIDGVPIDTWCDRRQAGIEERISLFRTVCAAVHHAHRNLIVHRDIKPKNILVADEGGRGVPKLLDFGIAKIQTPDQAVTITAQRFLTPEYASPEQVRGETISTASDIYSLGVVLYELLSGRKPFAARTCTSRELERRICEQDPPPPSTALTEPGDDERPETIARARNLGTASLRRRLLGDLDNIMLMALRKEPERRYASVEQFSTDLRRHLEGLPVIARGDSLFYRSSRFVRRHRSAVAITVVLVVTLLVGVSWDAYRTRQQADVAAFGHRMLAVLLGSFSGGRLSDLETRVRSLTEELSDYPEEKVEVLENMANFLEGSRRFLPAISWHRQALDLRLHVLGRDGEKILRTRYQLGRALLLAGQLQEARIQLDLAREQQRHPGTGAGLAAAVLRSSAVVRFESGDYESPLPLFRQALEAARSGSESDELAHCQIEFARFLEARGETLKAKEMLRDAVATLHAEASENHRLCARACHLLGMLMWNSAEFRDAEAYVRRALAQLHTWVRRDDAQSAQIRLDLAEILMARGASEHASTLGVQSLAQVKQVHGQNSVQFADACVSLASLNALAINSQVHVQWALRFYEKRMVGGGPRADKAREVLGISWMEKTRMHARPDLAKAGGLLRRAWMDRRARAPAHWRTAAVAGLYGEVLLRQHDFAKAERFVVDCHRSLKEILGADHPRIVESARRLVRLYEAWGREADAAAARLELPPSMGEWPYRTLYGNDDRKPDQVLPIEYDDDYLEKVIEIPELPAGSSAARLWILGRAFHRRPYGFSERCDFHVLVNGDPAQVQSFDISLVFDYQAHISARPPANLSRHLWVPVQIPVEWLRRGENTFLVFKDDNYARHETGTGAWEYNNLLVGIDTSTDQDRSWWHEFKIGPGNAMADLIEPGRDYGKRSGLNVIERWKLVLRDRRDELVDRRREASKASKGELMIRLEIVPQR